MNAYVPVRRDLRGFEKILPPEYCKSPSWEVPIMENRDWAWGIVLAYLNPALCFRGNTVENRIKLLLNSKRKVEKRYLNCVDKYNPFLSKTRCVCNDLMEEIVDAFRVVVEDYCKKVHGEIIGTIEILQASSFILSCHIVTVFKDNIGKHIHSGVFPPQPIFSEAIVIFISLTELDGREIQSFSFVITREVGLEKQKLALKEILTITEISEHKHEIKKLQNCICSLPGIMENFIIALVKSDLHESILYLYKSPYVLSKLSDAQFIVDPIKEDSNGLSALLYALILGKTDVFYFLYDQGVNGCFFTPGTVRSPDPIIVENLTNVKSYLDSFYGKLKALDDPESCKSRLRELCRFNEFQIEACSLICRARQREPYYSEDGSEDWGEAEERKRVILCILQTYEMYFSWNNMDESGESSSKTEFQLFKNFLKHADYFDHLDFCAAVMFFDNLYSLKERLKLSHRKFSKIESQFFFFIYCRKYFEAEKKSISSPLYIMNRMILFQERLVLKQKLASFKKNLENAEINEKSLIRSSDSSPKGESSAKKAKSKNDDETLTELPEIYGEILLCKLKLYIYAAINVPLNDIKAKFVIQRALYVLGESVKESDFKSVQKVLTFSLPEKLLSYLKQIRNTMRHPYPRQIPFREKVEENTDVFKMIQQELKALMKFFQPVFRAHENMMDAFNLKITVKAVCSARKKEPDTEYVTGLRALLPPLDSDKFQITQDFGEGWKKYFNDIYESLKTKLVSISKDCKVINKSSALKYYKVVTSNLISAVEKKLATKSNVDIDSSDVDNMFWSLEFLLTYVVKDKSLKSFYRELLNIAKFRLSSIQKCSKRRKCNAKNDQLAVLESNKREATYGSDQVTSLTDGASFNGINRSEEDIKNHNENTELLIQDMKESLHKYQNLADRMFSSLASSSDSSSDLLFESIEKFRSTLKTGKEYLTSEEGRKILQSIPTLYKDRYTAIEKIKEFLKNGKRVSEEVAYEAVFELDISESKQQELIKDIRNDKSSKNIDEIPDYYKELKEAMNKNEIGKAKFDILCKNLELTDSSKEILSKIVIRQIEKVPVNQFEFYRSRVKYLKLILIDAHRDIKLLWETAKSERKKAHLEEKLVRIYLSDPAVQASVEMLLLDCMTVLNAKDLKKLWVKTENLMRGIYLKNILAHGNPLLENLGRFLDPCDLPSQLIKKVLMLIRDENVLDSIQELCQKSDGKFGSVMGLLNNENQDEVDGCHNQGKIQNCDRWMSYVYLLPRQQN